MSGLGDVLAIARKARGLTQTELAELVGVTQPTINRYESGDRDPEPELLPKLAAVLGVTEQLLAHGNRFRGALAVDAHMRRLKTTKASAWRQMEARLNLLRVHASFLFEEVSIASEQHVPAFDADFTSPEDAARMVRAQWRMPMGPVANMTRWLESAGCLVFQEDFGTPRIDGLSQWVGDHPVILLNANAPADRKRLTLAHELGHLVLHSNGPTEDVETEANAFAAEFLMPANEIRPELHRLELGTLIDLKREWGVSMQAILERAYRMKLVTPESRTKFYKMMNARGWKTNEPGGEFLADEKPSMPAAIGQALKGRGFTAQQAAAIAGYVNPADNPFQPEPSRLRAV
ncbi:helix-turn-helix domain-containing protein [Mycobacteroides abscessus]|uniref:helix-turn-helix domain-containing protein n=1 Tax=Mycobacteroides abscessus TaxID=36809 RepID=UPI0002317528|nr:XRE family transcriptional regulator [Mycobacteroides abscessus]QST89216.1 MerR-like helix-turn-helix DNA binding protein [Mycobacterium phage prophiGD44-1]AWG57923.1 ImmA/IrrE family metallo-endopeptidase [Mycobacteroides abscessus]EHB98394.1 putative transcriptional regulatory protein [Mycobacteroides abscessus 47J26]MBN7419514.1 XRE family transcriptional regulator [Mycobacteroides abscessus subsp. massiliense]MDM2160862.1 XRE family transcriptional regulator [Mycobacteroides abscessus]